MIEQSELITFIIASMLLGLAPGPDNLFVMTQSALRGYNAGLVVTLGLCTGLIGHSVAVAFGVAVMFQNSAIAFAVLKFTGAGYLAFLAWRSFRVTLGNNGVLAADDLSLLRLYRRGIIMNITNPKVSLFFIAFLPQFADPSTGSMTTQLLILGAVFIVVTVVVFGALALFAGVCGKWMNRSARVQKFLHRLAGSVLLTLAAKLALAER